MPSRTSKNKAMRKVYCLFTFIIMFFSCQNNETEINNIEKILKVKIVNYKIIRNEDGTSPGKYYKIVEIQIEKNEFNNIVKKIKKSNKFIVGNGVLFLNLDYYNFTDEKESIIINSKTYTITYSQSDF